MKFSFIFFLVTFGCSNFQKSEKGTVDDLIAQKRPAFEKCYQQEAKRQGLYLGRTTVLLRLSILSSGRVKAAEISSDEELSRPLSQCLLYQLHEIEFPKFKDGKGKFEMVVNKAITLVQ